MFTPRYRAGLLIGLALPVMAWLTPRVASTEPAAPVEAAQAAAHSAPSIARALQELESWVNTHKGKLGASIVDLDSGAVKAEINAKLPLNPASNMKLVTAAVVLGRLGPEFTFTTGLYGHRNGERIDELVLRGTGDPSLSSADLWQLASTLKQSGVSKVAAILVDQSRFDAGFVPPGFEQKPEEWAAFRAPVSAVAVNENTVTLHVLGQEPQNPARVWFEPQGIVSASGQIMTQAKGSGQDVRWTLQPRGDRLNAVLSGRLAAGMSLQFSRRLDDPRLVPGYVLRQQLLELGIEVGDAVGLGGEKISERLALHESAPLAVLLRELGKASNNFYAEMLLKSIGAQASGAPASSRAGSIALENWLTQHGAWVEGTILKNGSGLYDSNRLSAWSLTKTLGAAFSIPKLSAEYVSQLAIGGVDGTLSSRFRRYRDTGVIRAKTGTLNSVDSLSGFVLNPRKHSAVAFSLLVDGVAGHHTEARERIDAVVAAIAEAEIRSLKQP